MTIEVKTRLFGRFDIPWFSHNLLRQVEIIPTIPKIEGEIRNRPRAFAAPLRSKTDTNSLYINEGNECYNEKGETTAMVPVKQYVLKEQQINREGHPIRLKNRLFPPFSQVIVYRHTTKDSREVSRFHHGTKHR